MSASSYPFLLVDVEGDPRERGRQCGSLAEGELWLCPGPVCENDYRRFTLRAR